MNYAVIMAGGSGKRLWPLSRQKTPKQVLRLFDGQTLLCKCFDRVKGLVEPQCIFVLTNAEYAGIVRENLEHVPPHHIIAEPAVRDTAGAVGLAAAILHKHDPNAVMAVLSADQILEPISEFQMAMQAAFEYVEENPTALIAFGIHPTFASTQFGYLQFGDRCTTSCRPVFKIASFKEKPDFQRAQAYLRAGSYYWNAGIFVWKASAILENLRRFVPENEYPLLRLESAWATVQWSQTLADEFVRLKKISIDYAVMEKASSVYGIELKCTWQDVGSYAALRDFLRLDDFGNATEARLIQLLNSHNNTIISQDENHLIALIGVENTIVVHTKDATLVCPRDKADQIKELVDALSLHAKETFL